MDRLGVNFAAVLDAAPVSMVVVDGRGLLVLVNKHAERMFGYAAEELIQQPIEALLPERAREDHRSRLNGFLEAPTTRAMAGRDVLARKKDGTLFVVEVGLNALEARDGKLIVASVLDVTERRRAEDRFRMVIEATPSGILMIDRAGRIVLANRPAAEIFGRTVDELAGQPLEVLIPATARATHHGFVEGYFNKPAVRPMGTRRDLMGVKKDGTEISLEIGLNPIETPEGLAVMASVQDVTARRAIQAETAMLAAIVTSSVDAISSHSLDAKIMSWNRAAEELFGYTAEEVIGQSSRILLTPEEQAKRAANPRKIGEPSELELPLRRKDGTLVDVSVRVSPIFGGRGELLAEAVIARDITKAKQRDAELRRSNAELEQFAYVASHDLQEPLRMVANYVELLAERYKGKLDERADKYIHYASDGARRMQGLVSDLLQYSRIGSQAKPMEWVESSAVLQRVLAGLGPAIAESKAVIEHDGLPRLPADATQLEQLFQNLIANAIKFRAGPPRIKISAVRDGEEWRFSVADNGIGMDMRFAERIFQMFQRLHEIGKYPGSGIGLALAKRIVERHGGRIWVESEPGRGSTFYFTLAALKRGS